VWTALEAFGAPLDPLTPSDLTSNDLVFQIGRLAGFSSTRLMTWLTVLGRDMEIVVRAPARRRHWRLRVHVAAGH